MNILSVDLRKKTALLEDGRTVDLFDYVDHRGQPTTSIDFAVAASARTEDGLLRLDFVQMSAHVETEGTGPKNGKSLH